MAKDKASKIELSVEEQRELESLARRRSTGQALAQRARIVLAVVEGGRNTLSGCGVRQEPRSDALRPPCTVELARPPSTDQQLNRSLLRRARAEASD
jgi:hypothetical protein